MANRLILYDTCNYRDYPVGGQLTSIRSFLRFLMETYPSHAGDVLLVGVSTEEKEVGRITPVEIAGQKLSFLAVTKAETDLGRVRKSLRLAYVQGLWKYRKLIGVTKTDCNYIHTPEAFGAVRLLRRGADCFVFSHGTYFDMWRRVRFFKKAPLIRLLFQAYLLGVIRKCRCVFVLDEATRQEYAPYSSHIVKVANSIECHPPKERKRPEGTVRFLYAGRLSKVKDVGPLIEAVKTWERDCSLLILGDGEERQYLEGIAGNSPRIRFLGAVTPDAVQAEMEKSHILVMNSNFEGIPMTLLEGLSRGLPAVTTDVGGIGEVLHFGTDAEKTDGTVPSIQRAMERVLDNYERYAKAAYETASGYDYRKVNAHIIGQLNEKLEWKLYDHNETIAAAMPASGT